MFVNYWRDDRRETTVNLSIVRVLFSVYALWKLVSYHWIDLTEWPYFVLQQSPQSFLVTPWIIDFLPAEVAVSAGFLVCVLVGYRLRVTAFVSAVLLAHLSGVYYTVTNPSSTFLPVVYYLLFIALFAQYDVVSVDGLRRTRSYTISELNQFLKGEKDLSPHRNVPLRYLLITIALIYFFTGWGKMLNAGVGWMDPSNLRRTILTDSLMLLDGVVPPLGKLILEIPLLAWLSGVLTVVFELGFLPAVLLGLPLWPFALGLLGMHLMIALSMRIFFFDQFILFALFIPWDTLFKRFSSETELTIIYDEHCYFCARSLYLFKIIDIHSSMTFESQYTVPEAYKDRDDVNFDDAMYVFEEAEAYEGYYAFARLLKNLGPLVILSTVMHLSPVEKVGDRVYHYIAENRSRHFTCAVDVDD